MHSTGTDLGRVWAVALATTAIVIAGCSSENLAEQAIERGIENESGENVDIDLDGGNIRIETEDGVVEMNTDDDGNISIQGPDGEMSIDAQDGVAVIESDDGTAVIESGGTDVPDDFPASVPLPDGFTPQFAQSMTTDDGGGWVLSGVVDAAPADVAEAYAAALESAGFERLQVTETGDAVFFGYENGEYSVNGGATDDGGGVTTFSLTVASSQG